MPQFNLIQAPELLLRLSRALGLKQPHITPTLNDGVQAVVLIADVTRQPSGAQPHRYGQIADVVIAGANVFTQASLNCPVGSPVRLRLHRVLISTNGGNKTIQWSPSFAVAGGIGGVVMNPATIEEWGASAPAFPKIGEGRVVTSVGNALAVPLNPPTYGKVQFLTGTSLFLEVLFDDLVIPPGMGFFIGNGIAGDVNQNFTFSFEWSETTLGA